jgi:hypothetical protein
MLHSRNRRNPRARARRVSARIFATIFSVTLIFDLGAASGQSTSQTSDLGKKVVDGILNCLSHGGDAVLLYQGVQCEPYLEGADFLKDNPNASTLYEKPTDENIKTACSDLDDARRLPAGIIKALVKQPPSSIDPTGIRILGALFCDGLDLIGLDLAYSLVLDKSIFRKEIDVRNFHTRGDFSLDESIVKDRLFIARTRVDGTLFASDSAIDQLQIVDSQIFGSLLLRNARFRKPAIFDTLAVSGELSVHAAKFPYLFLQYSKVGGVLDLGDSGASCAYHIRQTDIGDLVAVNSGFGTREQADGENIAPVSNPVGKETDDRPCQYSQIASSPGTFLISDTRIKSSLCLRSFNWPNADVRMSDRTGFITLKDVVVGTTAAIDLDPAVDLPADGTSSIASHHHFNIVGLETNSLIFSFHGFDDGRKAYQLSVNGLKFQNVYAAKIPCDYSPDYFSTDVTKPSLHTIGDPWTVLHLPAVKEVMSWLDSNSLVTTQPFAAFVDVFQRDGRDSDAKDLRIAKASTELCVKARRVFGNWICGQASGDTVAAEDSADTGGIIGYVNAVVALAFGALLWLIADHGFHPEKVGWFVILSIFVFALLFWFKLKIVGIKVKETNAILPVGVLFLFDRLLPAYQIRDDHYRIASFYKKVPLHRSPTDDSSERVDLRTLRYIPLARVVVETNEMEREHAEKYLSVLKVIGLVLAIFLVAAINAFVSR